MISFLKGKGKQEWEDVVITNYIKNKWFFFGVCSMWKCDKL